MKLPREVMCVLEDMEEYLHGQIDIVDGEHGPQPNSAMSLSSRIRLILDFAEIQDGT